MNKEELLSLLSALPNNAEVLVDIGDRYNEGFKYLVFEIRKERSSRSEQSRRKSEDDA